MGHRRVKAAGLALLAAAALPAAAAPKQGAKAKGAPEPAPELRLFKEATFLLPSRAQVAARWVLPPTSKGWTSAQLAVDPAGAPLLALSERLLSPTKAWMVALDRTPTGLAFLSNGLLVLAVERDVGTVAEPAAPAADKSRVPLLAFQPLAALPLRKVAALAAAGDELFCAGESAQGKHAVYRLRVEKGAGPRDLELAYESPEPVTALAADAGSLYVAAGRSVVRVARAEGAAAPFYTHPSAPLRELAVTPAGLFASTGRELVFAGPRGSLEVMRSSGHHVAARGGALYVLFEKSLGVLALENLGELASLPLEVRALRPGEGKPALAVEGLRFFEAGPPPWTSEPFADTFAGAGVRRIVARFDFRAEPSRRARRHAVSVSWHEPTGGRLRTQTFAVALAPGDRSGTVQLSIGGEGEGYRPAHTLSGGWVIRAGPDALGKRYPGRYRVAVEVDGVPAAEGSFTFTGEATPADAIAYDDVDGLRAMLDRGASARGRVGNGGRPLLHFAVWIGSARAVELLLQRGALPDELDPDGKTALAIADPMVGDWRTKAQLLVRAGADVNARVGPEKKPLVYASLTSPEYVAFLVKNDADPRTRGGYSGATLISQAAEISLCNEELLDALLARGAPIDEVGQPPLRHTPLGKAISHADESCVRLLAARGVSFRAVENEERPRSALYAALARLAYADRPEARRVVQLLVSKGATLEPEERAIMFSRDNASFFDSTALAAAVLSDDEALRRAGESASREIRDLALRAHVARVRQRTEAATSEEDLRRAHDHCGDAARLVESGAAAPIPELPLACGLLEKRLGMSRHARANLGRWLTENPGSEQAPAVRAMLEAR